MPWLSDNPLWETFASRALFSATCACALPEVGATIPRAAAFETRIAALWADPGQWDQRDRLPLAEHEKAIFPDGVEPDRFAPMEAHL